MIVALVKLYSAEELLMISQEAFYKAYNEWKKNKSYPFKYDNADTLDEFCDKFNVRILDYVYGDSDITNCYIKYEFTCSKNIIELKGYRLFKYLVNNYSYLFSKPAIFVSRSNKLVRESKILYRLISSVLTDYYLDNVILEPIKRFIEKPDSETTYRELIDRALNAWLNECNRDVLEYYSVDNFLEYSVSKGLLYTKDGELFRYLDKEYVEYNYL